MQELAVFSSVGNVFGADPASPFRRDKGASESEVLRTVVRSVRLYDLELYQMDECRFRLSVKKAVAMSLWLLAFPIILPGGPL